MKRISDMRIKTANNFLSIELLKMLIGRHIKIYFSKLKKGDSKENEMKLAAQPQSGDNLYFLPRGEEKKIKEKRPGSKLNALHQLSLLNL